ncbi:hypothetical protein [Egicoccus sp. AB-alg6-2]|uniref:hypothetical protein n=1 Tax=Egicoccus sp. AB-alg6-2 TaxID=3242692 RepID=UPI00359EE6C1
MSSAVSNPRRHRRRPTRRLLVAAVVAVATLLGGAELLLRTKPLLDTTPFLVENLPPIGIEEDPGICRRGADEHFLQAMGETLVGGRRITSGHVYACPSAFDGLRVVFVGEAIGEVLPREGGAWLQVNDDDYALEVGPLGGHRELRGFNTGLSVWLPDGLHEQIEGVGRPGRRGDILQLEGVLHRADPQDGGGITLRADHLEIVSPTVEVVEPFHAVQAVVASMLALIAVASVIWSRRVRRR